MGSFFDTLGIRKRFAMLLNMWVAGRSFFGLCSFKTLITASADPVQRGAWLVEEMASAARSLKRQSPALLASVSAFTLPAGNVFPGNRLGFSTGSAPAGH